MPGHGDGELRSVGYRISTHCPEAGLVYRTAVESNTVHSGPVRPYAAYKDPARFAQFLFGIRINGPFQRIGKISQPKCLIANAHLGRKRGSTVLHLPFAGADETVGFTF